jgi:hypothetical protein
MTYQQNKCKYPKKIMGGRTKTNLFLVEKHRRITPPSVVLVNNEDRTNWLPLPAKSPVLITGPGKSYLFR